MQAKTLFAGLLIFLAVFLGLSIMGINTFYSMNVVALQITCAVLAILTAFMLMRSPSHQMMMAPMGRKF